MVGQYKVITLCGSTRFKDAFVETQKRLTLEGNIVISVGLFGHSGDNEIRENMDEGTLTKTKKMLDDMHRRKIDMADEIFIINVGGYIGSSTRSEIEYASETGKTVRYLEDKPDRFIPDINIDGSIEKLKKREKDILGYTAIMAMSENSEDPDFQKKYNAFYRVRRDEAWRKEYYRLMSTYREKGNASFGIILLRLFQATGRVESSFASKMLATLDADMPIWDSKVLKALQLRLKGSKPEIKMPNAVILYDRICEWYKVFLQTEKAKNWIQRFDQAFPGHKSLSATKKIDFILWAS